MKIEIKGKQYDLEDLVIRGVDMDEQEIVINASRVDDYMTVYTSDNTYLTKLKKLTAANPKDWAVMDIFERNGDITGVKFRAPKCLLSLRTAKTERVMTDEQRAAAAERLKAARSGASSDGVDGEDD